MHATFAIAVAAVALGGCTGGSNIRLVEKSMEPTIRSGEYAEFDAYAYTDEIPERGHIVSFVPPAGSDDFVCGVEPAAGEPCGEPTPELSDGVPLVKRVIGVPGDTVAIRADGIAIVNDAQLDEPYVIPCSLDDGCELPKPITVPAGHYFMLGDNRPYSGDSRHFGPVAENSIDGRITPPDR